MKPPASRIPFLTWLRDELYEHCGPYSARIAYFEHRIQGASSAAERVYLHHKIAHLLAQRDKRSALSHMESAFALAPQEPWYLIEMAFLWDELGELAQAEARLREAQELVLALVPPREGWYERIQEELARIQRRSNPR